MRRCDATSQAGVARFLGVSATQINQALKGIYPGNLERLKKRVEGAYLGKCVECPVVGELALHRCLNIQDREYAPTNHQRVALFIACRNGCSYSHINQED